MARGEGFRVRLARIPGETPKGVLRHAMVLPAVLGTVGWTEEALHSEYDTVRAGQFSQPAMGPATARRLRVPDDIETLTVTWDPAWLVEQGLDPRKVRDELYAVLRARKPVELLMTPQFGKRSLLRMNITIRSITAQVRQGEPDTVYFTLRIAEWRNAEGRRRGEGRGSKLPTTHKLTAEDTLYSLSERYYNSSAGTRAIAHANGISVKWGKKTRLVLHAKFKVGSKLKIPKTAVAVGSNGGTRSYLPGKRQVRGK